MSPCGQEAVLWQPQPGTEHRASITEAHRAVGLERETLCWRKERKERKRDSTGHDKIAPGKAGQ